MAWVIAAVCFLASLGLTRLVLALLRRRNILDRPNERSSHTTPTPRGGGLAVLPVVALGWLALGPDPSVLLVLGLGSLLAALGWLDDLAPLPVAARLTVQVLAVALGLLALPEGAVLQGLVPTPLDRALAALAWIWFINLFNFMDGIDGLAGVETLSIGLGAAVLALAGPGLGQPGPGLVLAAAAAGFLVWNWHPARIFLGDVGSIGLGYLLGWMLLDLAARGHWAPALLLPMYYLCDATWTLLRRLLRRERVWQAHRTHFYQRAALQLGHDEVALAVLGANLGLLALALLAVREPGQAVLAVFSGLLLVGLLLFWFGRGRGEATHGT